MGTRDAVLKRLLSTPPKPYTPKKDRVPSLPKPRHSVIAGADRQQIIQGLINIDQIGPYSVTYSLCALAFPRSRY
jgi:hypothetical protein